MSLNELCGIRSNTFVINNEGRRRAGKIGWDRVGPAKVGQGGQVRLVGGWVVHEMEWGRGGGSGQTSRRQSRRGTDWSSAAHTYASHK